MKNKAMLTVSLLCTVISAHGSDFGKNFSSKLGIEQELSSISFPRSTPAMESQTPDERTASCVTIAHRTSVITNPHELSPLDLNNVSSTEEQSSPNVMVKQLLAHRYRVSSRASDLSTDWRKDSLVDENGNAHDITICPSKNERLFEKSYLAAALRGMKHQNTRNSHLASNNNHNFEINLSHSFRR